MKNLTNTTNTNKATDFSLILPVVNDPLHYSKSSRRLSWSETKRRMEIQRKREEKLREANDGLTTEEIEQLKQMMASITETTEQVAPVNGPDDENDDLDDEAKTLQYYHFDDVEELKNVILSEDDIIEIADGLNKADNHFTKFTDLDYFKGLCNDAIDTLNLELEHIEEFEKQYIRCYTSDITPAKRSIVMMAGGLDKIQLSPEAFAEYKRVTINHYNTDECFIAGLQPLSSYIADYLTTLQPKACELFSFIQVDDGDELNVEYIADIIEYNKNVLIEQRLIYEQLKEFANKVA